jgi:hypothetical protein
VALIGWTLEKKSGAMKIENRGSCLPFHFSYKGQIVKNSGAMKIPVSPIQGHIVRNGGAT